MIINVRGAAFTLAGQLCALIGHSSAPTSLSDRTLAALDAWCSPSWNARQDRLIGLRQTWVQPNAT